MKNKNGTLAQEGLKKIVALFKIEKEIETLEAGGKVTIRQEKAKTLVDVFFSWCEKHKDEVLSKSKIHTAFQYALNHKKGLSEYLNDGYLPMTNSLDERTIRMFTIGRKNWLFSTSVKGVMKSRFPQKSSMDMELQWDSCPELFCCERKPYDYL